MKLKSTEHWAVEGAEGLLFFAQRLDELLFDYTLDTYKPPALNSAALCKEALGVISDVERNAIDPANIDHVLDELVWSIQNDLVAKDLLDTDVHYYVLRGEKLSRSEQKTRLAVLQKTLNPHRYSVRCEERLIEGIVLGQKKVIDQVVRNYISNLINCGVGKAFLHAKTNDFFFNPNRVIDKVERVKEFFEEIELVFHQFKVYFKVDSLISRLKKSNRAFSIEIMSSLPEEIAEFAREKGFLLGDNECFVEVSNIQAVDAYTAREKAEQRLDQVADLFMFFSHRVRLSWSEDALLTQCCTSVPSVIGRPLSSMSKGQDTLPVYGAGRFNNFIENMSLRGGSLQKFRQAIDLHGMALKNDIPSNQLINIWIALETIVPTQRGGGSTVAKIAHGIMPYLLEGYVRRLVLNATKDLLRWDARRVGSILEDIKDGRKAQHKVLRLIVLQEFEEKRGELFSILNGFPLLRYRIFSLHERFSTPAGVIDALEIHRQKIEWQIRRIYRTRNLVVHAGDDASFIGTLIENSHDYLDVTLSNIIDLSCREYQISSLEQAFELGRIKYMNVERFLKNEKHFTSENVSNLYSIG